MLINLSINIYNYFFIIHISTPPSVRANNYYHCSMICVCGCVHACVVRVGREWWREGGLQADGSAAAESSPVEIPENLTHPPLGRDGEMNHGNTPLKAEAHQRATLSHKTALLIHLSNIIQMLMPIYTVRNKGQI